MPLDLTFLTVPLRRSVPAASRPVNVYDILREGWRETRVDMTLAFFLDPNRRHGLGSLVIDALLSTLDGAPLVDAHGPTAIPLGAAAHQGSTAWRVETQVDYIDVLATNADSGLAIVLENKIEHVLNNPLKRYATSALESEGITHVLVAVLAPEARTAPIGHEQWMARSITYVQLAEAIKSMPALLEHVLDPADRDQRRSLDLLQQFMEVRTGGSEMNDLVDDAASLDEWRSLVSDHREAIAAFLEARRRALAVISARRKRLEPLIADRFAEAGLAIDWEAHGDGSGETWNAYHFTDYGWSVELKFSTDPNRPAIFVYYYPGRGYTDARVEALSVEWTDADAALADAFLARVSAILGEVVPADTAGVGEGPLNGLTLEENP